MYDPLNVEGVRRDHLFAFARTHGRQLVVVMVPRLIATLLPEAAVAPTGERVWGDTRVELPMNSPVSYRHVLTQQCVRACPDESAATPRGDQSPRFRHHRTTLRVADIFSHFPVAFLEGR
jgi:(1->4)-alpha-D-glucan 1-alpha-D-glucosylmutase